MGNSFRRGGTPGGAAPLAWSSSRIPQCRLAMLYDPANVRVIRLCSLRQTPRKISDRETDVKVVGLEQIRTYRLQAEPWEAPKYNADASEALTKRAIVEANSAHG